MLDKVKQSNHKNTIKDGSLNKVFLDQKNLYKGNIFHR